MADTRALLNRIAAFRQRLEGVPPLAGPPPGTTEPALTHRARHLLEAARQLVGVQRSLSADALLAHATDESDPLTHFHRGSVALTETAIRLAQTLPANPLEQLAVCDGLEQLLKAVRDRLSVLEHALAARRTELDRIDALAGLLAVVNAGRSVSLAPFVELAEALLAEARRGLAVRFAEPFPGAPARCVAAHALTVAGVMARLAPLDYEWATQPAVPVVAALLMDVAMLRVPPELFAQTGPMTPAQKRAVEAHARTGGELVHVALPEARALVEGITAHHERLDGTGYPNGLHGESVPTLARFLAVADCYAGLCSERPHRRASDPRTALTECLLLADAGLLDRDFAEYLLHLSFHPVGTVVELTDGRTAVVVANPNTRADLRTAARPVVAVLSSADRQTLARPEFVDLGATDAGGVARALTLAERRERLADTFPELAR